MGQRGPKDGPNKGQTSSLWRGSTGVLFPHQTNRTEPESILHNFIRGFGFSRVVHCSSYPHICPPPLSSDYCSLRPQRTSSVFSSPALFVRRSFLSLTLPCISLVPQSICSPFNSPTWAPFAVVLRFALSPFFPYSVLIFPSKVIDFDADVNLFHFMLLRCVGKGAFGKVPFSEGHPNLLTNQTLLPGSCRSTQADTRLVRPQIHQQNKMRANEGRRQCHSGATLARGGVSGYPPFLIHLRPFIR